MELSGPLIAQCSTWLTIVSKLFGSRMQILLEPHNVTAGQFSILHHITRTQGEGAGGIRISDIAAAVEVEQPAVTKTIAKFQVMGLVEIVPSPKDKRAKLVTATPAAGALIGKIYQDIGPDLMQVFSAVDTDQIEAFLASLKQLGQWLDQNRLDQRR